jgi:hypothetical protein
MATVTLPTNTPLEPLLTPLSLFRRRTPSTPLSLSPSPLSISPPCSPSIPLPPSLVLDLSLHPPQPLTSQLCSGDSVSTLPLHSHPTASVPLTRPAKCLLFRSPLPKGEGVKQALAWNREQLLDLRRLWELWLLQSVDRSVRLGRCWGCPECRWQKCARTGLYRSPYNGAMDKHTRGRAQVKCKRMYEVQGLYKVCTREDV